MKLPVENTATGAWLKKEELKNGDVLKIVSEAKIEMGQKGEQLVVKVKIKGGDNEPKNVAINKPSRRAIVEVYGDDTLNWIDKTFTAHLERMMVAGKRVIGLFLIPDGYEVVEDNDFLVVKRIGADTSQEVPQEINPADIPF